MCSPQNRFFCSAAGENLKKWLKKVSFSGTLFALKTT
jgi:hypothetical protein